MDALSDVLRVVRLTGGVFLDARFTPPWSLVTNVQPERMKLFLDPATQIIGFHSIVRGRLTAHVLGGPASELKAGDLILLPRNDLHVLGSAIGVTSGRATDIVMTDTGAGIWTLNYGGGGDETHVVRGFLGSDSTLNPVIAALPPLLPLTIAETPGGAWIAESFAFAAQYLASGAAGGASIIASCRSLCSWRPCDAMRRSSRPLKPAGFRARAIPPSARRWP
jgi:hypothetical protein